ncbi:hypothetical protein BSLG_008103 [Batrachochytrium salamandrivorans]|nr:hypothetical protein BSLG_008103 [Batrachochytrium salamandrivorans]
MYRVLEYSYSGCSLTESTKNAVKRVTPESVLKKRKTHEKLAERATSRLFKTRSQIHRIDVALVNHLSTDFKQLHFILDNSPCVANFVLVGVPRRDEIRLHRQAGTNNYYVLASKFAFVIRIKGINKIAPKPRKILFNCSVLPRSTLEPLSAPTGQFTDAAVGWTPHCSGSSPTSSRSRELVYKRGFAKVNRQRIPITNNQVIEQALTKFGIICVEDLCS